jgi:hypothetical protein
LYSISPEPQIEKYNLTGNKIGELLSIVLLNVKVIKSKILFARAFALHSS